MKRKENKILLTQLVRVKMSIILLWKFQWKWGDSISSWSSDYRRDCEHEFGPQIQDSNPSGQTVRRHRLPSGQLPSGQVTSGQFANDQFTSRQFTSGKQKRDKNLPILSGETDITRHRLPSGQFSSGQFTSGQITSGQFASGFQKQNTNLPITSGQTAARHRLSSGPVTSGQLPSGLIKSGQFTSGKFTSGQVPSGQGQAVIQSKSSNDVQRLKGTSILDSGGNLLVKEILEKQLQQKLQNYRCAFKYLILQLASSFSSYILTKITFV